MATDERNATTLPADAQRSTQSPTPATTAVAFDPVYRFTAVPRDYTKYESVPMFIRRQALLPLIEQGRLSLQNEIKGALACIAEKNPRGGTVAGMREVALPIALPVNYQLPADDYFFGARVAFDHATKYIETDEIKHILSQSSFATIEVEMGRQGSLPSIRLLLQYAHGNGSKSHWILALYFATRYIYIARKHGRQSTFITTNFCHNKLMWRYKLDERGLDRVSVSITANATATGTAARTGSARAARFTVRFFWFDSDEAEPDATDAADAADAAATSADTSDPTAAPVTLPSTWACDIDKESTEPGPKERQASEEDVLYAMEQTAPAGGR